MENLKARLFTIWCWTMCGLSTAFWATISIAGSLLSGSGRFQHFCMRRWSKDNLWLSRTRVEIEGLENIDLHHPQILVVNHSGLHDILSLSAHLPIQFRWVAKKPLFSVPFMGWHMRRSGYISINQDNPREAAKSIIAAAKIIAGGVNVIVFPEGSRSPTGELGAFYGGAFSLAARAGVPVVPVIVEGSYRVIAPLKLQVNPGTIIRVKIDRPIDSNSQGKADKRRLMADAFRVMSANLTELQNRRRRNEELEDAVCRWIHGKSR